MTEEELLMYLIFPAEGKEQECRDKICAAFRTLREDRNELRKGLRLIQGMAGNPDAEEACRLIIKKADRLLGIIQKEQGSSDQEQGFPSNLQGEA